MASAKEIRDQVRLSVAQPALELLKDLPKGHPRERLVFDLLIDAYDAASLWLRDERMKLHGAGR